MTVATKMQTITTGDPLFASVTWPTDAEPWIALAREQIGTLAFGGAESDDGLFAQALAWLSAHMMASNFAASASALGGSGGTPAELRAGKWSIRYQQGAASASADSDAALNGTAYGREYLRLRGLVAGFPRSLSPTLI